MNAILELKIFSTIIFLTGVFLGYILGTFAPWKTFKELIKKTDKKQNGWRKSK